MNAKLPLVPSVIINWTCLTAGVYMKVRLKSKVTTGFSLLPLRDFLAAQEKPLEPGYHFFMHQIVTKLHKNHANLHL